VRQRGEQSQLTYQDEIATLAKEQLTRNDESRTMLDFLLSLLAGWPAIVTTVILAIIGLVRNNHRLLLGAAILAVPFSWYLSGFPVIRSPVFLTPVLLFCSAWAMRYGREMLAWILGITFFLVVILLFLALSAGVS